MHFSKLGARDDTRQQWVHFPSWALNCFESHPLPTLHSNAWATISAGEPPFYWAFSGVVCSIPCDLPYGLRCPLTAQMDAGRSWSIVSEVSAAATLDAASIVAKNRTESIPDPTADCARCPGREENAVLRWSLSLLLAQGWEIAGYASGYDNRTSLILFRHPGVNAFVQCGILYDVTRAPRTVVNCYELR